MLLVMGTGDVHVPSLRGLKGRLPIHLSD